MVGIGVNKAVAAVERIIAASPRTHAQNEARSEFCGPDLGPAWKEILLTNL